MKRKNIFVLGIAIVVLAIFAYGISLMPMAVASAAVQPAAPASHSIAAAPKLGALTDMESLLENIYQQVSPSIVTINVVESQAAAPNIPGLRRAPQQQAPQAQAQALGSGFIWDSQGHIVTNNHVIDGASSIQVVFSDGTTVPGKVVGADPDSDLAVLQVTLPNSSLHPVPVADSTQVKVGQFAIAIGNPYGEQNTMTTGIVSALGRSLPVENAATANTGGSYTIPDVIQTDAPINPGNSGGVLLNADGQIIGVTSAIESPSGTSAGIGFAIPAAIVQRVVPALIKTGRYDHPYIGISGTTVSPDIAQAMNLKSDQRGALVISVSPNGPADKAGLHGSTAQSSFNSTQPPTGGDIITAIDGQAVKSFDDLVAYLARSTNVNQSVTLTILRGGKEQAVKVILGTRPGPTT